MTGPELAPFNPYDFGPGFTGEFDTIALEPATPDLVEESSFEVFDSFLSGIEGVAIGVGQTAVFAAKEVIAHIAEDGHASEELVPERTTMALGELAIEAPEPEPEVVPPNTRYEEFILSQFKETDFN